VRSSLSCANTCMSFGRQGGVADASPQCRAAGAIVAPRCCGGGYGLNAKLGQSVREVGSHMNS
jgi:hypothetical protein